jgi:hypothetical protein
MANNDHVALKAGRNGFSGQYGLPIRKHALSLRKAGYSLPRIAEMLQEYYQLPIHKNTLAHWLGNGKTANASNNGTRTSTERYDRQALQDATEQWLSRNDSEYRSRKYDWQARRTDALVRDRAAGELGTARVDRRIHAHETGCRVMRSKPKSDD